VRRWQRQRKDNVLLLILGSWHAVCATGESVVPKQTNEMEADERRADGSRQGDRAAQASNDRTSDEPSSSLGLPEVHHRV